MTLSYFCFELFGKAPFELMYMSPLPLLVVVAVKVLGVVTPPAETWSICNDSNFTIVSVSIDICARIKIILQPCCLLATSKLLFPNPGKE